jgi:hypothetical protein
MDAWSPSDIQRLMKAPEAGFVHGLKIRVQKQALWQPARQEYVKLPLA